MLSSNIGFGRVPMKRNSFYSLASSGTAKNEKCRIFAPYDLENTPCNLEYGRYDFENGEHEKTESEKRHLFLK